jgi:hypothetical protein
MGKSTRNKENNGCSSIADRLMAEFGDTCEQSRMKEEAKMKKNGTMCQFDPRCRKFGTDSCSFSRACLAKIPTLK